MRELWISLIQSYKPWISVYLTEARKALKKASLSGSSDLASEIYAHLSSLFSHLNSFRGLVNDTTTLSTQDGLEAAIHSAHYICYQYDEQDFISVVGNTSNAKALRNALGLLGRLKTCFHTLVRAAERLANFQELRIIPVISSAGKAKKSTSKEGAAGKLSVAQLFSSLGLSLDDQIIGSLFIDEKKKKPWTKRQLLQEFDKRKSPISQVHAEVQVSLAATRHDCTGANIFNYVGCSKRSCILCATFIQRYKQLNSRGCHGKLYNLWTIPEISCLAEGDRLSLMRALEDIEKDIKSSILGKKSKRLQLAKESTVGGSSLATVRQHSDNPYAMSLVSQHLEAQRANITFDIEEEFNDQGPR